MFEEQVKILKDLKKLSESIKDGKYTMHDIPDSIIHDLLNDVFGAQRNKLELVQSFHQIFDLANRYGNSVQQGACFGILKEFIQMYWETGDKMAGLCNEYQYYKEIVTAYAQNQLTEQYIDTHTWGDVALLKDGKNVELFWQVSEEIRKKNIERIRKQDKIKVAFMTKDSSEWSADSLYQLLLQDDRYEVYVLVAPFYLGTEVTFKDTYTKAVKYFEDKGYSVYGMDEVMADGTLMNKPWQELPVPDVIFMLNPHERAFHGSCNVKHFPLKTLITYIPYGYPIYGNTQDQYNQISHALCWKIFWEDVVDVEISRKHADLGDRNVEMSGYLKMDGFYMPQSPEAATIWKIPEGKDANQIRKIVYAPHWSIREASTGFGNFDKIYDKIYEYAQEHADTTSWIFRPHPMLRAGVVWYGVFKTESEFDAYMQKWDALPNARVVERGEYLDIFKTSDAIVGDSVSFCAEYQYTHKPLLLLTRDTNTWDEFGTELLKILYTAPGEDFGAVETFIEEVVINQKDPMYQERIEFFDKYLDYKKINGKLACEYIKDYLDESFRE